jgi:5-methylcytosine-specific restriction endonuclease McrA
VIHPDDRPTSEYGTLLVDRDGSHPSLDHLVPRSLGGSGHPRNLVLCHKRCNGRRGNKIAKCAHPKEIALSQLQRTL